MFSIMNLLLFIVSVAAGLIAREIVDVQADLRKIDDQTTALHQAVLAYTGGLGNAIPIAAGELKLERALESANLNAAAHGDVTSSETDQVIAYITDTLEPHVSTVIDGLIGKKGLTVTDGLVTTVHRDLITLKEKTNVYGKTLLSKAPAPKQAEGNAILAKILGDMEKGIQAFS